MLLGKQEGQTHGMLFKLFPSMQHCAHQSGARNTSNAADTSHHQVFDVILQPAGPMVTDRHTLLAGAVEGIAPVAVLPSGKLNYRVDVFKAAAKAAIQRISLAELRLMKKSGRLRWQGACVVKSVRKHSRAGVFLATLHSRPPLPHAAP